MSESGAGAKIFISRSGAEKEFAVEVAAALRAAGADPVLQDGAFDHPQFAVALKDALSGDAGRVLALISPEYLASEELASEAMAALDGDMVNRKERLVPVLVAPCPASGVLTSLALTSVVRERQLGDTAAAVAKILRACGLGGAQGDRPQKQAQILHSAVAQQPNFVGRDVELAALSKGLWSGEGPVSVAAVVGALGVGKTTLVMEYAWRNRARYRGVWRIAADTRENAIAGLTELGAEHAPELAEDPDRAAAAAKALRALEQDADARPWLLIFDDVVQPEDLNGLTPQSHAHVLMTSRDGIEGAGVQSLTLAGLPAEAAIEYLCTVAGREDRDGAASLADALRYMPLALSQAAQSCLADRSLTFAAYQAKLPAAGPAPTEAQRAPEQVDETPIPPSEPRLRLALEDAEKAFGAESSELAKPLVALASFLEERGDLEASEPHYRRALALLEAANGPEHPQLATTLNNLASLLQELHRHEEAEELFRRALDLLEAEHGPDHPLVATALNNLALLMRSRGALEEAEPLLRRALAIEEATLGAEDLTIAGSLNNLAGLLRQRGALSEAEGHYRRAVDIAEAVLPAGDPTIDVIRANLAQLQQESASALGDAEQEPEGAAEASDLAQPGGASAQDEALPAQPEPEIEEAPADAPSEATENPEETEAPVAASQTTEAVVTEFPIAPDALGPAANQSDAATVSAEAAASSNQESEPPRRRGFWSRLLGRG